MNPSLQLQPYQFNEARLQLYVPNAQGVRQLYRQQKQTDAATAFPYWTQVWPAALGMCHFLSQHLEYITHKKVLELAAGLGLPSLLAAHYAQEVCCSDYLPEAVAVMQQSVHYNHLHNMRCRVLNWHHLPAHLNADVLLLSDINYNREEFKVLLDVIKTFLQKGTTILLSTPQRLMAKPFVEQLLSYCVFRQEMEIQHQEQSVNISVLVLKQ